MKIVLAFDSYKGCMTAEEACHAAAKAIHEVMPDAETIECPLSDGGEGLVDCVEQMHSTNAAEMPPVKRITFKAHDPLMNIIDASYIIGSFPIGEGGERGLTAYMEMAATSGLPLVPTDKRNPMITTTYGVGEMIIDAAKHGCKEIVMGIGGSATCDGGKGMIQCLKDNGYSLPSTELPHITVASDVTNPLYGEQGAAYIFGPQKGATPEQVVILDKKLRDFARETEEAGLTSPELALHPGSGAAGGLGYGLMAYLKAELKSGIDIILDIRHFNNIITDADIVITGEGKSDEQTLMGKVPDGVLSRTGTLTGTKTGTGTNRDIKTWLLSGSIDDKDGALARNFSLVRSINADDNRPLDILMQPDVAKANLAKTVKDCLQNIK